MVKTKNVLGYLVLSNTSSLISFFIFYSDQDVFDANFNFFNISKIQIYFFYNLTILITFLLIDYIFRFESVLSFFSVSYFFSVVVIILLMWLIKFVNLSRLFLITNFFLFLILLMLVSRIFDFNSSNIYITFDHNLERKFSEMIYIDENSFPLGFLNTVSNLIKTRNLKGIVYEPNSFYKFSFNDLVELSNFLGVDIYEFENEKRKLIHKSTSINKFLKNIEDVILLIIFGIPSILLILLFSFIALIFQGRPVFYTQSRVGENGNYFKIYKFRTMQNFSLTNEQIDNLNERDRIVFKSSKDPRITKLGKFFRKSSIDELPQVINVFKNEMSFIGPRPPIIDEVNQYELKHLKRISIKPGITGLWQVTLRQNNDFDKWVEKDIEYIENWSLRRDFLILYKTIFEIINLTGE